MHIVGLFLLSLPLSLHDTFSLMHRRTYEDMQLFSIILNQEIRRLSTQVIRVKWSLHAREEIVFELLQHLKGNLARALLDGMRKSSREMIEEQEAVRGRLFTIQDVMQSTVCAWLQEFLGVVASSFLLSLDFLGSMWMEYLELEDLHMHLLCSLEYSSC